MKKKILSLLLVLVMLLGMLPMSAAATEGNQDVVYLSISFDGKYIDDKNGDPIVYRAIPLDEIAAIDLMEYGLDNMLFDADGDGNYETTALQMLIYAHEELYGGDWNDVNFDALPGSSYFTGGIFDFTANLVYFQNGDFPVDETQEPWGDVEAVGATSDRIVLKAGDFIDVASFSCYSFLWDMNGGFNLFADENDEYVHEYTATAGEALNIKLIQSFCNLMSGVAWKEYAATQEVHYGSNLGDTEYSVTTNASGNAEIIFPHTGTYYVWCDGGAGSDGSHDFCDYYTATGEPCIVSAPAYAKVTVTGGDSGSGDEGGGETEQPECEHDWNNGVCSKCEAVCEHGSYEDGKCTVCETPCTHNWSNGVCTKCEAVCEHGSYENGKCTVCEAPCPHSWNNGVCDACGDGCDHEYENGVCKECTYECKHTAYENGVCKECKIVCGHAAYENGVCKECEIVCTHAEYENGICKECTIVCEHTEYADGKCAECGIAKVSVVLNATLAKLATTVAEPSFGTNYGEWSVFSLARGNYYAKDSQYFKDYYTRILYNADTAAKAANLNGALDTEKSTDNSRLIFALSSIGIDATAVGAWDLVKAYSANGINWIGKQGLNGTIWALIALDSGNYVTTDTAIRQQCVDKILAAQHNDGGWSLVTNKEMTSNVDITGMALAALYPYKDQPAVAEACAKAIAWLSTSQLENGGFPYGTGETSESCVWAIVGLTTWGINPDTDPRFVKNGNSAIDNLLTYYLEESAQFEHFRGAGYNAMATDQASYALVAYDRFVKGEKALFDMSDVVKSTSEQQVKEVTGVELNETEISIAVGEHYDLTATADPAETINGTVTWSSSDTNIATVYASGKAGGRITGKAAGTATVTVKVGGKTATCIVTVTGESGGTGGSTDQKPEQKTITVTMRLIGADLATQDVDLGETAYLPNYVTWMPTAAYTLDEGATVYDLWMQATGAAGIGSIGAGNDYVETVWAPAAQGGYALSEFTNGARSGWMYTVNGSHPGRGLKYRTLNDGDTVIWHYVNDYAWEVEDWSAIGGGGWPQLSTGANNYWSRWLMASDSFGGKGGALSGSNTSKNDEDEEETATTLTPEVSVNASGEAKAEVSSSAVTGALEQAAKDGASALEIVPEIKGEASKVEVELPADALTKVADSGLGLNVSTPVADVKLPNKAVSELAEGSGKLAVTASAAKDGSVTIDVSVGGKSAAEIDGGLKVSLPKVGEGQVMVIVGEDGTETIVTKHIAGEDTHQAILPGSATVKVIDNRKEFSDTKGHWGENAINFVTERNLYQGVGNGLFDANGTMTRAMLVTVLYRLEGKPVNSEKNAFSDVADGQWYTDAIAWANANKIVTGVGGTYFDPNAEVTREQIASVMYRYAKYLDMSTNQKGDLSQYEDDHATSDWAKDAKAWAVGAGLISGKPGNILDPGGDASRTEVASILQRLVKLMVK